MSISYRETALFVRVIYARDVHIIDVASHQFLMLKRSTQRWRRRGSVADNCVCKCTNRYGVLDSVERPVAIQWPAFYPKIHSMRDVKPIRRHLRDLNSGIRNMIWNCVSWLHPIGCSYELLGFLLISGDW